MLLACRPSICEAAPGIASPVGWIIPAVPQVLVLVELLHSVTSTFDKYRAVRYQQSLARELQQHRKLPQVGHRPSCSRTQGPSWVIAGTPWWFSSKAHCMLPVWPI